MGTVVVDSGVLIAVLDAMDEHHESARRTLLELGPSSDLVLPASAYSELMVHPHVDGPAEIDLTDAFVDALPARIEPIDRNVALTAAGLRARFGRSLRLPDALVIGTAVSIGAELIVTTDSHWPDTGFPVKVLGAS